MQDAVPYPLSVSIDDVPAIDCQKVEITATSSGFLAIPGEATASEEDFVEGRKHVLTIKKSWHEATHTVNNLRFRLVLSPEMRDVEWNLSMSDVAKLLREHGDEFLTE